LIRQFSKEGRPYYKANERSQFFSDIKDLVVRGIETADMATIPVPGKKIREFCRRNSIEKLSFFGSVLRSDFGPDSDIDVLVEFEEGKTPGLFGMSALEQELTTILEGRKIDLRTPADLSRHFRGQVVKEARVIYDVSRR
jgi:predicted nucleotidyltransferase